MKRIPSLDGLRAISVTLVVAGHWITWHYHSPVAQAYANLGVRVFFVISGYLITTLLLKEHAKTSTISLREFYVRRAYRILPAAMAFMLPVFVLYRHSLRWYDVAAALFYLMNFSLSRPWMLAHLWSLSVEEQFYFLWPSVLKKWYRHRVAILAMVIGFAPIYRIGSFLLKLPDMTQQNFPAVADTLAVGCLLAIFAPRIPKIRLAAALLMLIPIVLVPWYLGVTRLHTLVLLFLFWPIMNASIAGFLLHVVQSPWAILNIRPVVWLGKISYSLYLWQELFIYGSKTPWYAPLFAVGLASLSYYLVEQPMLRLRERRSRGGRSQLPASHPAPGIEPDQGARDRSAADQRADAEMASGF
jgi:peptidoglycan/LPS O-acetylase OafA/YrhL